MNSGMDPSPPQPLRGVVRGLHHVAIVVPDIEAARATWEGALGLSAGTLERIESQAVDVLVMDAGGQRIELVAPTCPDSPVSRFLERRGPGLHHLAWRVDDLDAALAHLRSAGLRLIDEEPVPGAHGTRVAFLHPKSMGGVLTELVEEPRKQT